MYQGMCVEVIEKVSFSHVCPGGHLALWQIALFVEC